MSRVFVATETTLGRQIAVKVFPADSGSAVSVERFKREIQVAAALQHPHIVPLLAAGEIDGVPYYTMPFVKGESLRQRLEKGGELSINATVHILHDVAAALAYAHGEGVVHRDIKPENIMLSGGVAVVTDFGVAKAIDLAATDGGRWTTLTSHGMALGTPAYMAPEQASADPQIDQRADIYAFGCVAYEMLAGSSPFAGRPAQQLLAAQVAEAPASLAVRRPNVSPGLAALVMKCLEKRPGDRPQSADELLAALDAVGTPSGGSAPVPASRIAGRRWFAAAGITIVAGTGVVGLVSWAGRVHTPTLGANTGVATGSEIEIEPAISPDGTQVAFAKETDSGYRIFVKQLAGGGPPRLLAPDVMTSQRSPQWTHDNSHVSFVASEGAKTAIYLVPAGGGPSRQLIDSAGGHSWSRDGREIVFIRKGDIFVADSAGGSQRLIQFIKARTAFTPALSPDGRFVAYAQGGAPSMVNISSSSIRVVSSDSGSVPVILSDSVSTNLSPVWSPDGSSLLYVSNMKGSRDLYLQGMRRDGRPRGAPHLLQTNLRAFGISLSSDGGRMVFDEVRPESNIWSAPIPARDTIRFTDAQPVTHERQHIEALALSGSGNWLAFDSDHLGQMQIFKIGSHGGDQVALTTDAADHFWPTWSGDSEVVYYAGPRKRLKIVGTRDLIPREVTREPRGGWDMEPTFSPDGRQLLFGSTASRNLMRLSRDGSGRWSEPDSIQGVALRNRITAWSPDRHTIIGYGSSGTDTALFAYSTNGEAPRVIADWRAIRGNPQNIQFGRDSSVVFLMQNPNAAGERSIATVRTSDGVVRQLLTEDRLHRFGGAGIATDGVTLYFTLAEWDSNVRLLELRW